MKKLQWMWMVLALTSGCAATVGVPTVAIPADAVAQCRDQCNHTGLVLGSVVIMASRLGCVCNMPGAPTATSCTNASAGAVGAMAQVLDEEAAAANQRSRPQPH